MNKILLAIMFSIMIPVLLGSAQQADAAFLTIDDSVDNQITLSHDPNWEGGVNSNGTPFGPFTLGTTINPGETVSFSGTWIAPFGNLQAGSGTIYFTDVCNPNVVSDIVSASWTSGSFPTITIDVQSSPDGANLGAVPAGFNPNPEPAGAFVFIIALFEDNNGDPIPIPSNLDIQFASDDEICPVVGGEFLPIDSTALLLAGLQSSAIWMLPVLAGVAGSAFGVLYIKSRRN